MLVHLASTNAGKLREFELAAEGTGHKVVLLPGISQIAPPDETGKTFEDNARLKAEYYSRLTPGVVLADDSGLEVDALSGSPGVFSARYAGVGATDADNNTLLLRNLANSSRRSARFVCVVALAQKGKTLRTSRGVVEGEILDGPRGHNGFGYDSIFLYPPLQRSFGELSAQEKLRISHRGKALRAAFAHLEMAAGSSR